MQSQHIAYGRCAGFKLERQLVVGGALKGNVLYHLAATLIGRHLLQQLLAAIHNSHAHRSIHLVTRKAVEVAPQLLHIDGKMRYCLRSVDQYRYPVAMGNVDYLSDWVDCTQCVAHVVHSHYACLLVQHSAQCLEVKHSVVVERDYSQFRPLPFASQLPGHYVAVMLHSRNHNLIALLQKALPERRCHKVDALGRAACKHYLVAVTGVDELLHRTPRLLILLGGLGRQIVRPAVYVAVQRLVIAAQGVYHRLRLLRRRCVVEVHQRLAIHLLVKYREL